jgi:hypothetical protein
MNTAEAKRMIEERLRPYRLRSYDELCALVGKTVETGETRGESGAPYQFEIQVVWDDYPEGWVRVIGSMDENPHKPLFWRWPVLRWIPIYKSDVMASFIMSPEGKIPEEKK